MTTVSLTENQLNQVQSYVESLDSSKNRDNFFIGKCGEIAVHNYGYDNALYSNLYGYDLFESILKTTHQADQGYDLILQSLSNKYIKVFAQVKTISCDNGHNLLLSEKLYNDKLEYYNSIPQDIFILVKRLSLSTYELKGFIMREDAIETYKKDMPVKGCYCINEKHLQPIEELESIFK